jgi:hypothetical protein
MSVSSQTVTKFLVRPTGLAGLVSVVSLSLSLSRRHLTLGNVELMQLSTARIVFAIHPERFVFDLRKRIAYLFGRNSSLSPDPQYVRELRPSQ